MDLILLVDGEAIFNSSHADTAKVEFMVATRNEKSGRIWSVLTRFGIWNGLPRIESVTAMDNQEVTHAT